MARTRVQVPLNVFLNGRHVGIFRRASSGAVDFQYGAEWLNWANAIPVSLSLPLREDRFIGDPVIAVFENLLPDNDRIRNRIAQRVAADGADAFSLLSVIGRDCVGALQFLPDGIEPASIKAPEGIQINEPAIASLLRNLHNVPLGLDDMGDFRISIAGAQEKTALLKLNEVWMRPTGATATTHILKPQIGKLPNGIDLSRSVENEHFCLEALAALGLPSARSEILDFEDVRVLSIERFDRLWARDGRLLRVPQEDMCQALSVPPSRKYEADGGPGVSAILNLLKASDDPAHDQSLFLKAIAAYWLLGATDGHAKNFSIFLSPGGRFRLTPLYDVMSAQPYVDARRIQLSQYKLAMAVGASRHYRIDKITPRHIRESAKAAGVADTMISDTLEALYQSLDVALDHAIAQTSSSVPSALVDSICEGVRRRAILLLDHIKSG